MYFGETRFWKIDTLPMAASVYFYSEASCAASPTPLLIVTISLEWPQSAISRHTTFPLRDITSPVTPVSLLKSFFFKWRVKFTLAQQGEAHKVLQSYSTQTIDHIQKCFRQKFQCSRRPSYSTVLNGTMYFFSMTLLPILRRIQRLTTQGRPSHEKYENSRKIKTYRNNHFQRIH